MRRWLPFLAWCAALALPAVAQNPYIQITTTSPLPGGYVGIAYSNFFRAVTYQFGLSVNWSLAPAQPSPLTGPPPGLNLNSATGELAGTPTTAGTYSFVVQAQIANRMTPAATGTFTITIATPSISIATNALPNAILRTPYSVTLAATSNPGPIVWTFTGALPPGLNLNANGQISGTPTTAGSYTFRVFATISNTSISTYEDLLISVYAGQLSILNSSLPVASVSAATPPSVTVTVGSGSGSVGAAQQVPVNLLLSTAYSADITAALMLTFQSSVGGDDQTVQFITSSGGTRSLSLTIPLGSLAPATAPVLATGTVAGTITITTQLSSPGVTFPQPSPTTITIAKGVPVIQSVAFSNTGGGLTVTVIGYSTTRDMVSGDFTFATATGSTLAQSDIQVQLGSAFSTWYQNGSSSAFGSQFKLTMPFTVSGNAADVISVIVKLTNSFGTSIAVSPQ